MPVRMKVPRRLGMIIHLPPRASKDHSRQKNNWGRKIVGFCGKDFFYFEWKSWKGWKCGKFNLFFKGSSKCD